MGILIHDDDNQFEVERDGDDIRIWRTTWEGHKSMTIPAALAAQIAAALVRVDRHEAITASVAVGAVSLSDEVRSA